MSTAFLITAYDQIREVTMTVKILRTVWKSTAKSPIVIVISGDTSRNLVFPDDPYTRIVHLDDMVGDKFRTLVSTSIMRQITHGMLEVKDLEREFGPIEDIVHMHGDILLLEEKGFFAELDRWKATGKPIAADNVGAQRAVTKEVDGRVWSWGFFGCELMPQLFAVDHAFCKHTGFMYDMEVIQSGEKKATETALIANLHRAVFEPGSGAALLPNIRPLVDSSSPYQKVFDELVHCVKKNRTQWGVHEHWGGFMHYGNSFLYSKEAREGRALSALRRYGLAKYF